MPRVSIHAPAKGRLTHCDSESSPLSVSIHAPAKGRPTTACLSLTSLSSFNPRPREGATGCRHRAQHGAQVSIHAPAKGRPVRPSPGHVGELVSIHAPAKGRPVCPRSLPRTEYGFQSTPPRRGDGPPKTTDLPTCGFNPRPREGATTVSPPRFARSAVSIHAPAKGRPAQAASADRTIVVSIHAPAKGRPDGLAYHCFDRVEFQSTPPRRGDHRRFGERVRGPAVSIHAPAKGRQSITV